PIPRPTSSACANCRTRCLASPDMAADGNVPDAALATEIATQVTGHRPSRVARFTTGVMHYVFEATFRDRAPIVVRIAGRHGIEAMRSAAKLSRQLRP